MSTKTQPSTSDAFPPVDSGRPSTSLETGLVGQPGTTGLPDLGGFSTLQERETSSRLSPPSRFSRRIPGKLVAVLLGVALVGVAVSIGWTPWTSSADKSGKPLTVIATKGTLRVIVTERGNLESSVTVDGVCELIGSQNKLIQIVPEGTHVKKGDVVCRFDSGEIDKNIAQQEIKYKQAVSKVETSKQEMEIQRNEGESGIIDATVELKLANLDVEKYEKGDYQAELDDIEGAISLAKKDLEKASDELDQFKALMKKGFKSPQQVRVASQELERQQQYLKRDSLKKQIKEKFEYRRKMTEFTAKADSAQKKVERAKANAAAKLAKAASEYEAAKATTSIEKQQLDEFQRQKDKTILSAAQDGIVAYANDRWYDPSSQIREGAMVYSRQKIFSLPDMTKMQVKVNIHESFVKKIRPGLKAEIRVDAFPNLVLQGTVKTVSNLADSARGWMSGGVKEYSTVVTIDKLNGEDLKPGMTSEVRIQVKELPNVLMLPIQALAERKGDFFAFVETSVGYEKRKVKAGETNEKYVEILEGLKEGEVVALDARTRLQAAIKAEGDEDKPETSTKPAASSPAATPPG